jgi:hypothetical protein
MGCGFLFAFRVLSELLPKRHEEFTSSIPDLLHGGVALLVLQFQAVHRPWDIVGGCSQKYSEYPAFPVFFLTQNTPPKRN